MYSVIMVATVMIMESREPAQMHTTTETGESGRKAFHRAIRGSLALGLLAFVACSNVADSGKAAGVAPAAPLAAAGPNSKFSSVLVVYKNESCGCCGEWVKYVQQAGLRVEVHNQSNLNDVKVRLGVPYAKGSCHTAEVDGYLIEGHVPVEDIRRLLAERPDARGLVVAGMPAGSPGMEMPDGHADAYTVELVNRDGSTQAFSEHAAVPPRP